MNRCASHVDRHDGRVIWLTYEPEGKVEKTLYMVGKGITYDTGGADIKVTLFIFVELLCYILNISEI